MNTQDEYQTIRCECDHFVVYHKDNPAILGEPFRQDCYKCECKKYKNKQHEI